MESRSSLPSCSSWRCVQHALAVVRVQVLDPELEGLQALLRVRGNAADVAKPVVDEDGALAEVHLVEREAGEVGARRQASLARAKRLFGALALGDVDGDAHQALRLAGGVELGPRAGGDPPDAAIAGEDDPVLHVDGFARTRGPLRWLPDEVPVVGMDRRLETLQGDDLVRRVPEDRASPLRGPEDARAVVQGPEPRLGGVRRQGQALLALPQAQLVAPPGERVGEDLRDQLQPLHERVRPVALRPQGVEAQGANGRLAPHREREAQVRLDAEQAAALPGRRRPPPAAPPARKRRPCGRPASAVRTRGSAPRASARKVADLPGRGRRGWALMTPGAAADHCQSTARSMPRGSQTRRSASSISRSTSPGGRLMNREERSAISVSNSRRLARSSAERCGGSTVGIPLEYTHWAGKGRNVDSQTSFRPSSAPSAPRSGLPR